MFNDLRPCDPHDLVVAVRIDVLRRVRGRLRAVVDGVRPLIYSNDAVILGAGVGRYLIAGKVEIAPEISGVQISPVCAVCVSCGGDLDFDCRVVSRVPGSI